MHVDHGALPHPSFRGSDARAERRRRSADITCPALPRPSGRKLELRGGGTKAIFVRRVRRKWFRCRVMAVDYDPAELVPTGCARGLCSG
jgi:hypothetical protein